MERKVKALKNHIILHITFLLLLSIHPFSTTYPVQGRGGLEPIPAIYGRETGYTLDWLPVNHRAHKDRQLFTPTIIIIIIIIFIIIDPSFV